MAPTNQPVLLIATHVSVFTVKQIFYSLDNPAFESIIQSIVQSIFQSRVQVLYLPECMQSLIKPMCI